MNCEETYKSRYKTFFDVLILLRAPKVIELVEEGKSKEIFKRALEPRSRRIKSSQIESEQVTKKREKREFTHMYTKSSRIVDKSRTCRHIDGDNPDTEFTITTTSHPSVSFIST